MTLGQKITERLNAARLAENVKSNGQDSAYVIDEKIDSMRVQLEIVDFDKFSYIVKTLSVVRAQAPPASVALKDLLLRQAGEIERRITYLLERFQVVEVDEYNCLAQVRSATPYQKDGEKFYYEVLLQHGIGAAFSRYLHSNQAGQRELVPCHLTRETFERLLDDLAAIVRLN
ncbi:MAG: hypothetical protein ALAOOOJD_02581 [bacterium]|nr:hypothetical protein [bacterium]